MGGPRKRHTLRCAYDGREFTAFRLTAKYCGDPCRMAAHRAENRDAQRAALLAQAGNVCDTCGTTGKSGKLFIRKVEGTVRVLCGTHNSQVSRDLFWKRVPNPGRGYAWRKFWERQTLADAESV